MTGAPPPARMTVSANGIAHVVLARPAKRNALDMAMFETLVAIAAQLRNHARPVLRGHLRRWRGLLRGSDLAMMQSLLGPEPPTLRPHSRQRQPVSARRDAVARTFGAGDRRDPRRLHGRRPATGRRC